MIVTVKTPKGDIQLHYKDRWELANIREQSERRGYRLELDEDDLAALDHQQQLEAQAQME